jgi:formylglycine-generating enzyme
MKNHIQTFDDSPLTFKMIAIEGGIFDMGSEDDDNEKPIHKVQLSDYWLGEFLVTQELWSYVMGSNPSQYKYKNRPVDRVSWEGIVNNFLPKLNKDTERVRPIGTEYRLPTEAQWEYAAKGGKYDSKYPFIYSGSNKLNDVCWYRANNYKETMSVGLKHSNLLGLVKQIK